MAATTPVQIDGQTIEVPEDQLEQVVSSGRAAVPNKEYDVIAPDGESGKIPGPNLAAAISAGFKLKTESMKKQEELEKEYGDSPVTAFGLGAARQATFGASDYLATKVYGEEGVKAIKELNPVSSNLGEFTGVVGPAILSGGTTTAAKAASYLPATLLIKGAEKAGVAVAKRAALNVPSKIAQSAIQYGVEGAIDGAAQGLIQTISEDALGDAEFTAEAALSNVGKGFIVGAGLGSLGGSAITATKNVLGKVGKGGKKAITERIVGQIDGDETLKAEARKKLIDAEKIEEGLAAIKDPEIQAIKAKYPDAPTTPGMESAFRPVRQVENYLIDAPDASGELIRKSAKEVQEYVDKNVDEIWSGARQASPEETGDLIRQTMFTNINAPREAGQAYYTQLMDEFGNEPVNQRFRTELANMVKNSDAYRIGSEGPDIKRVLGIVEDQSGLLAKQADDLGLLGLNKRQIKDIQKNRGVTSKMNTEINKAGINIKMLNDTLAKHATELPKTDLTLKQIKELQQDVGASIRMAKGSEKKLLRETYDELRKMQDSIIRETVGDSAAAKKIIDGLDAANADYRRAYAAKDELAELFGIKGADIDSVTDKLENMSAIDLEKKFLNIKKSDKARLILEKYPEIGKLVITNRQRSLINKHTLRDGSINYGALKKAIKAMPEEESSLYFGGNTRAREKLLDMLTLAERRPKTLNPSGTDIRAEVRNMLSPKHLAGNWALSQVYRGNESFLGRMVDKVLPTLSILEGAANKQKNTISSAVNGFYKGGTTSVVRDSVKPVEGKKLDKAIEIYEKIQEDPQGLINSFLDKNKDLSSAAPNTANALQARVIASVQFLSAKIPKRGEDYLNNDMKPSRSELMLFSDYLEGAENPGKVIEGMKAGYISPRALEAMRAIYPKTVQALQAELMAKMPKVLTKNQRIVLQQVLGANVVPAMGQQGIAILQSPTAPVQGSDNQSIQKARPAGVEKMKVASRAQSSMDKVLNRS